MGEIRTTALKPRVLIADDTPDTLTMIERLVCGLGLYRCDTAIDGLQAIDAYEGARSEQDPFKLLLLDAAMPHFTGFEVAEHVRVVAKDNVPIIIITAYHEPINQAHASYVKADEIIEKPFDPQLLEATLRQTLGTRSAAA
jgi:two-component system chemotaxis response regulator CheY